MCKKLSKINTGSTLVGVGIAESPKWLENGVGYVSTYTSDY